MGKQAEESQSENAEEYRKIIENISDACFALDLAGTFAFLTIQFAVFSGIRKKVEGREQPEI